MHNSKQYRSGHIATSTENQIRKKIQYQSTQWGKLSDATDHQRFPEALSLLISISSPIRTNNPIRPKCEIACISFTSLMNPNPIRGPIIIPCYKITQQQWLLDSTADIRPLLLLPDSNTCWWWYRYVLAACLLCPKRLGNRSGRNRELWFEQQYLHVSKISSRQNTHVLLLYPSIVCYALLRNNCNHCQTYTFLCKKKRSDSWPATVE